MDGELIERNGVRVWALSAQGPALGAYSDAVDLIGEGFSNNIAAIAIPMARLDPEFFNLRSGLAGEFVQKIVGYRFKLAIVGDIAGHVEKSTALRDFVRESNRGSSLCFLPDLEAALVKLAG